MIAAAQNFVGQTHNMLVDGKIQKREYIIPPDEDSDDEEHSEEEVTLSETEEGNDKGDEDDSFVYEEAADDEGEIVSLGALNQTTDSKQGEEGDFEATFDDNIDPGELLEETLVIDEGDEMETKPNVVEIRARFKNGGEKSLVNPLDQTHFNGDVHIQNEEFGFGESMKMEKFGFEEKMEIEDPGSEEWKQLEMLPEGWKFKESPKIKGGKKVLCPLFISSIVFLNYSLITIVLRSLL